MWQAVHTVRSWHCLPVHGLWGRVRHKDPGNQYRTLSGQSRNGRYRSKSPAALGTAVQPALISQASMTCCGDREGAGSSSCHQDLNPRRAVGGYHVGLGSGSHRNLMCTQEPPKLALSDKNSQSAPRWLARSLEGLEQESLAEFPKTTSSSSSDCVCDPESCFHLWGAPASQAARGHRPLSVPASDYPSLPLSQLRSPIYILWRDSFCGNLSRNPDFDSKEVWEV